MDMPYARMIFEGSRNRYLYDVSESTFGKKVYPCSTSDAESVMETVKIRMSGATHKMQYTEKRRLRSVFALVVMLLLV
jgi:hypothetical protein